MTLTPWTDAAERFALGSRNGIVTPTAEPVSDTDMTPFGLSLRTIPRPRTVVPLHTADGVFVMATEKVTSNSTDGSDEGDTTYDVTTDI
jgi:hypothetical protein